MKLFLSSLSIPHPKAYKALFEDKKNVRVALICNAWGSYETDKSKPFINAIIGIFMKMDIQIEILDLLDYIDRQEKLDELLSGFDGVWITGGNTYYLNWTIHQAGLDAIILKHCRNGLVYGGESAGAIVAGPTLKHFETLDNPEDAPMVLLDGMKLTDTVVVPHFDNPKYGKKTKYIVAQLRAEGFKVLPLNDNQALVVDGGCLKVL
ncbi:MAG: Type 1 glutamine amidotransferase-like domain-containing protein [Candidatus Saccharibacteria bacterium]